MLPAGLDTESFLREYWQKKPLLLRTAVAGFEDPLSPEELAGLACEEEVESRLVQQQNGVLNLRPGPFQETDFTSLPDSGWTLLVQSVDLWVPKLRSLFDLVSFLPAWRLDDLMISYATDGAGTGPHFDYYDVFILQGSGSRIWRLGQQCDAATALDTHSGLKILSTFDETDSFELHTGDLLYIPAGLAHHGASIGNSMSYSIGFRAPSAAEIIGGFAAYRSEFLPDDLRYRDPDIPYSGNTHPGEITVAVGRQLSELLTLALQDQDSLLNWFGGHMTEARYPELLEAPEEALEAAEFAIRARGIPLVLNPASRLAFRRAENELVLYCDGNGHHLKHNPEREDFIRKLCGNPERQEDPERLLASVLETGDEALLQLITALYNAGAIITAE